MICDMSPEENIRHFHTYVTKKKHPVAGYVEQYMLDVFDYFEGQNVTWINEYRDMYLNNNRLHSLEPLMRFCLQVVDRLARDYKVVL